MGYPNKKCVHNSRGERFLFIKNKNYEHFIQISHIIEKLSNSVTKFSVSRFCDHQHRRTSVYRVPTNNQNHWLLVGFF